MIDTIILNIPYRFIKVIDPDKFRPSLRIMDRIGVGYMAFYNNQTAQEKRGKIYRPKLTLYKRGCDYELKIQFSPAMLLFRNNLFELIEEQIEEVLDALQKSLFGIGVVVDKEVLRCAYVAAFHPSKNIPISGGYSAMDIISEINKMCVTEKLDIDNKDFRNGGHGVQLRAESHALTFYDKMKDLEKGDSRSYEYEKNQKIQRQSLFYVIRQERKPEILRMEARLCERQKMKSILKQIGLPVEPIFANIFKKEVCQKVLLYYFKTYIEPNFFVFDFETGPQDILKGVLRKNPNMKFDKAVKLTALKLFCKDKGGARSLRGIVEARIGGERKWQRVAADIKTLNRRISLKSCHGYIREIKQALQKFKPYKPEIG